MGNNNYTNIDDLVKKHKSSSGTMGTGGSKEYGPIYTEQTTKNEIQEVVEHETEQDVKPFLKTRAETIELPPDLKQFGLQPANTTHFSSYQNITLPISDDKVMSGLHAPITSSVRWLATLALYLLQKAHLGLKSVHGKVVRVIRL